MIGDSAWRSENQNSDRSASGKNQVQEISVRNKDFIGCWTPHILCFGRKFVCIFLCPENLPNTEIKDSEIINFVEEISSHSKLRAVTWLLFREFSHICVEN